MSDRETEKEDSQPDGPKVKKRKVLQKYRYKYELKYPVIRNSGVAALFAYCTLWHCDFSVWHGGIGDVERHVKTTKHAAKVCSNPPRNIQHFFTNSKDLSVIRAETLFTEFIIDLHRSCSDLHRRQWSLLNRFRTGQGHCNACHKKWGFTDNELCDCGEIQKTHIPAKTTSKRQSLPWLSGDLKRGSRKKHRMYKKCKTSNNPDAMAKYKKFKKDTTKEQNGQDGSMSTSLCLRHLRRTTQNPFGSMWNRKGRIALEYRH